MFHQILDFIVNFGTEFLAFIVLAAIVAGFSLYFGRNRLMPLIAGLYAAIPLYMAFPFGTTYLSDPWIAVALYLFLAFLGCIAFSGLSNFMAGASRSLLRTGVLSILVAGMLIAIGIHLLPLEKIYAFNAPTRALFVSPVAYFLWLVAPIAGIFFLER